MYGAVIMAQSRCESSPGSLSECRLSARWPPTLRPSQTTWAAIIHIHHRHCYYYSVRKLILILTSHVRWKAKSTWALQ